MKNMLPYSLLMGWVLMFCANFSIAQTDTLINRNLGEIDVIAKRNQRQFTMVQSITQNEIKIAPTTDIASILRTFSGTNVKDYGGVGGLKTVSVRSLGASHTTVEYDGVPVSDIQAGQIDISRFELNNVSEIKLSVGQDDNLLKPAKFFAGGATLSINSFDGLQTSNQKIKIGIKTGSFGLFNINPSFSKYISKRLKINILANYMRSDGTYKFKLNNYNTQTIEKRKNSDINSYKLELNLNYYDSIRKEFKFKTNAFYSNRGLPGSVIFYNTIANERLKDKDFFVQTSYKHRVFNCFTTKLIAKYSYAGSFYTDKNVKYSSGILHQDSKQNEIYFSWANLLQISNGLSFSLSQDYSNNLLNSNITDRKPIRNTFLTAANLRYTPNNIFSITTNAVQTIVREKTDNGNHFPNLEKISPSAGIIIYPLEFWTIRLFYKNTFRVPTFNELYYTTLGTTNLKPENAREFNIGNSFNIKNYDFSIDIFRNYVTDKIIAIPTLYIWKMSNYGHVEITGIDFNAKRTYNLTNATLNVSADCSYQKAIDITDNKSKLYKSQIPYTPKISGSFSCYFSYKKNSMGLSSFFTSKRYFLEYNIPDNEIEKYADFSFSMAREFFVKKTSFFAKFSCLNFTNKQYEIIKYYPMPRRQFRIELEFLL